MSVEMNGLSGRITQGTGEGSQTSATGTAGSQTAQNPVASTSNDTVNLTSSATNLQQLTSAVAAMPVVDAQRVNDVQRAVGTGSFQFEPATAADNMITQERDLALLEISK